MTVWQKTGKTNGDETNAPVPVCCPFVYMPKNMGAVFVEVEYNDHRRIVLMKKIKVLKAIISAAVLMTILACSFIFTGCNLKVFNAAYHGDGDGEYKPLSLIMNAGEKLTIDRSHFNNLGNWNMANYDGFELEVLEESHEGVVTIKKDVITAGNSGSATIMARLYAKGRDANGKKVLYTFGPSIAEIYVINEATMTEIRTAQQLADIKNDLGGNYILKSDIDLADWGEWSPIGTWQNRFKGMFVNLGGYKIKNLTISTGKTEEEKTVLAGLFGAALEAFFSGIILENINIDCSDYEKPDYQRYDIYAPYVGGLAAFTKRGIIMNCSVSGNLTGKLIVGGIVGLNNHSTKIIACNFKGTIEAAWDSENTASGIGGIVGMDMVGIVKDCNVLATINGNDTVNAGGIVGCIATYTPITEIINCVFEGEITGLNSGTIVGQGGKGIYN